MKRLPQSSLCCCCFTTTCFQVSSSPEKMDHTRALAALVIMFLLCSVGDCTAFPQLRRKSQVIGGLCAHLIESAGFPCTEHQVHFLSPPSKCNVYITCGSSSLQHLFLINLLCMCVYSLLINRYLCLEKERWVS